MSLTVNQHQTMTLIPDDVNKNFVKKLYAIVQTLRKTQPDRSSQFDTVCEVRPLIIKQHQYPNAYAASLFIPNKTQTPSL